MPPFALAALLAFHVATGGQAREAQSAVAGDPAFALKQATERVMLASANGAAEAAVVWLQLAESRLNESITAAQQRQTAALDRAVARYEEALARAAAAAAEAESRPGAAQTRGRPARVTQAELHERLIEATTRHLAKLEAAMAEAAPQAQMALMHAYNQSLAGCRSALSAAADGEEDACGTEYDVDLPGGPLVTPPPAGNPRGGSDTSP